MDSAPDRTFIEKTTRKEVVQIEIKSEALLTHEFVPKNVIFLQIDDLSVVEMEITVRVKGSTARRVFAK